ncbi:carbohydrate ABC transporter permease [Arthrobacter glacialis]|uniref:ABC transporter permease n=1 Tax=Arthrobacter glacialis TaxID=1664 RepID=A0A2S3ZZV5_ARTGL|nr:sugar ABC transporter permease [Arthrobacter glacialis]POH74539.1 ABC transporter permease [Arthrobacter glacialis]
MQAKIEQAAAAAGAHAPAGPAGASRRSKGRRPSAIGKEARLGLLLVLPAVAVIVILIGYPTISSIWYSFTDRMVGSPGTFIGLANYTRLVTDSGFLSAAANLVLIVGVSLILKLVLGTVVAVILNRPMPGRNLWRLLVMLPWAMPGFVAFMGLRLMFESPYGAINVALETFTSPIPFLSDPEWARVSVVLATVWRGFPFWAISILAALQTIPKELYEAARMDGASAWQQFVHITVPQIRSTVAVVAVISAIWTANGFENIWLMTQGGPSTTTMTFPVLSFLSLQSRQLGQAAAYAVVILPVMALFIMLLSRRKKEI